MEAKRNKASGGKDTQFSINTERARRELINELKAEIKKDREQIRRIRSFIKQFTGNSVAMN